MKQLFLIAVIAAMVLLIPGVAMAQNLIPNPSFELRGDSCVYEIGGNFFLPSEGYVFAKDWYEPTYATSDYFNACSPPSVFSGMSAHVPENGLGTQAAHSGVAYAGSIYAGENYTEYLETKLTEPLIAGHRYLAGFWMSLAEISSHSASRFGLHFSADSIELLQAEGINNLIAQVESTSGFPITDTLGWTHIIDTFVAVGGERWVTLGNFHKLGDADTTSRPGNEFDGAFVYYYYDDLMVFDLDGKPQIAVHDTSICSYDGITVSGRPNAVAYLWNDGSMEPNKRIDTSGIFWVKSINTELAEIHVDTFKIGNIPCGNCVFVPNAFSPNYDGVNDLWKARNSCSNNFIRTSIFNRLGQCVFLSDKADEGWDGSFKGQPCDVGTYYYLVQSYDNNNKLIMLRGDIALVK